MIEALRSRQMKSGSYAAAYVLVFLAILGAVNWLASQYNHTYDSTAQKLYSLSAQTHKILGDLDRDVNMFYFDRKTNFLGAKDMLVRYENASSRVKVEYIDPDEDPLKTEAMNVRSYGTLVLDIGGNRKEVSATTEEEITNAIITALKGQDKTACVATGHGEAASEDTGRDGFSNARTAVEDANYNYEDVSLASGSVPGNCTLLIVAGPSTGYFEPETAALVNYVEGGGRALLMLNPALPDANGRRKPSSPELVDLAARWGVTVNDDIVIDQSPIGQLFGGGPLTPMVAEYETHPIVSAMSNVATLFPASRSVERAEDAPDGWDVEDLFQTSDASFATTSFATDSEGVLIRNDAAETPGPINLAVAGTYAVPQRAAEPEDSEDQPETIDADVEEREGRIVVIGSSRFSSNYGLGRGGNYDLFLNMLNWLSSDEDLISIRPKDPENTPLDLSESQMRRIFLFSLMLLPMVIIVVGVWNWWGRR